jgi:hypothetical protein
MVTINREEWEEPGWTIAEHTGSGPVNPGELEFTVNHYPAANSISPNDPKGYARSLQRNYVNTRDYSVGYNWMYWRDGTEVELRGWDFRNAANDVPNDPGGENENRISVALLFAVPGQGDAGQAATPEALAAAQARLSDVFARCGKTMPNIVHGDLEPTQCAGAGINHQTHTGQMLPTKPIAPPIIIEPEDDIDMIVIAVGNYPKDNYAAFAQTPAGVLRWIVTGWELEAWTADAEVAQIPADAFQATVAAGRTLGSISGEVTAITGVSSEQWMARAIA